eukprot:scaffold2364_cov426-Prasinococcus_capsulatus_cf.AAC.17
MLGESNMCSAHQGSALGSSEVYALVARAGKRKRHPALALYGIHPDFHEYIDNSFNFLATSGAFGIVMALHKCQTIDLYGFQVHPRHGAYYHYYNKRDLPANEDRDNDEWFVVKAFAQAGLVRFADPCVMGTRHTRLPTTLS